MLSNENKAAATPEELAVAFRDAANFARRLGTQLVSFERHPDPKAHLNLPNPTDATFIRVARPQPRILPVEDSVKQHNLYVWSLHREGKPCR